VIDAAFFIVGIVALYFSLWTTSSLNSYWKSFISRINDLPHALNIQSLPHHTSLLIYYQTSETGILLTRTHVVTIAHSFIAACSVQSIVYTVFGYDVTREAVLQFARVLVEIAAFTLVLAYFVK
jgi:transcription initiation factor TFIIIB Brf1 subunit/transcription initiation factor TFIIB